MIRGITTFKCPKCGHKFTAPDIELGATALSQPMTCPKCGCKDCKPASMFNHLNWFGI